MDTITGMKTFAMVVTAGSFTGAAERLGISTALTSKYVGRLEERLGARLLNRTTRSLTLTEIGRVYFDRCQQIIEEFDALEAAIQDRQSDPTGHLIVSAPVSFGEIYLTAVVAEFLGRHPGISMDLRLTDRFVGLADEGIDLAVRISELESSSLIARRLAPMRIVACATPAYLDARGRPATPRELTSHDCIVDTNFRGGSLWTFTIDGERVAMKVASRFSVNSSESVRQMLLMDRGIALAPIYAVADDIKSGALEMILSSFEPSPTAVYAIYQHNRHLAPKVRAFVDFLVETFAKNVAWEDLSPPPIGLGGS